MKKLDEVKNEFKKHEAIHNFIKAYDEMCLNLQFKELIEILELIQDDMKNKKQVMVLQLKRVFPDEDWDNKIDDILNNKILG